MSEALFKVGSVYRQRNGMVVSLHEPYAHSEHARGGNAWAKDVSDGLGVGHRSLATGRECDKDMRYADRDLLPGELTQVNGEWVATPTLDKMEAERSEAQIQIEAEDMQRRLFDALNRSMIARDDTRAARWYAMQTRLARQLIESIKDAPKSTAKPANEALTRLSAQGHQFGLGR